MAYFLGKTDPESYGIDDLARDGATVWDGVRNAQAVNVIKTMSPGDTLLIYHSQSEAAIVGLAEITGAPRPDLHEPRSWVVDVRFTRKLETPITLQEIKEMHQFDDWSLVRQGRLSTMPVPEAFVIWLRGRSVL